MLEELVLGFIAGIASRIVSTPLNIVTLKLQTERDDVEETGEPSSMGMIDVIKSIYKTQGLAGFWRGCPNSLPSLKLLISAFFRFPDVFFIVA